MTTTTKTGYPETGYCVEARNHSRYADQIVSGYTSRDAADKASRDFAADGYPIATVTPYQFRWSVPGR